MAACFYRRLPDLATRHFRFPAAFECQLLQPDHASLAAGLSRVQTHSDPLERLRLRHGLRRSRLTCKPPLPDSVAPIIERASQSADQLY